MPGRPPRDVSKGSVHKRVDDILNHQDKDLAFDKRSAFHKDLANWGLPYIEVLKVHAGVSTAEADYLQKYWYSPTGFWPSLHPVEPLVRQGLIKAIEEADRANPPLPIDSYWLCLGGSTQDPKQQAMDHDLRFETIITRSPFQVTRILLTPRASRQAPLHLSRVPIWVVNAGETATPSRKEDEEGVIEDIQERQLIVEVQQQIVVVTTRLKTEP